MFNINWTYLIKILLPPILRQSRLTSWLEVILSYLKKIYNQFIFHRNYVTYDINFNGQLMYLEKKLQDTFNCNGIYIDDGEILESKYLWNYNENRMLLHIYNYVENNFLFLYNNLDYLQEADFIIFIPYSCSLSNEQIIQLKNIVNFYKILEKNYKITYYNE